MAKVMTVKELAKKVESLSDDMARLQTKYRQDTCKHNNLLVVLGSDGYLFSAKCCHCDKIMKRESEAYCETRAVKAVYKQFK